MITQKVLLAPNEQVPFDSPFLKWPMFGSIKFDGNRCLLWRDKLLSRTLKEQPNNNLAKHFREILDFAKKNKFVFDGEIWSPKLQFNELQEIIRAFDKPIPDHVGFYVFDVIGEAEWENGTEKPYQERNNQLSRIIRSEKFSHVKHVEQIALKGPEQAESFFNEMIDAGHEGIMVRSMDGKYKHNRASHKQGIIFKFKNYVTEDAVIIECVEQMQMTEAYANSDRGKDEMGRTKRSHRQDDFEPADTLGSLVVRMKDGSEVGISLGRRDAAERKQMWKDRKKLIGRWVEFSFMPHGSKDVPRIGKLERFRTDLD